MDRVAWLVLSGRERDAGSRRPGCSRSSRPRPRSGGLSRGPSGGGARRRRGHRAAARPRRRARAAAGRRGRGARPGAGGGGSAGRDHLLPQGVHPADPAVPRPLPLLHVRHRPGAAAARGPRHVPVARTRCSTSPAQGAALGCKEALFTLGDRPEDRWPEAREWLDAHGYDDTLAYVRAMAIRVLEETGLLPHLNPGRHVVGGARAAQAGRAVAWA